MASGLREQILARVKPTATERKQLEIAVGELLGRLWASAAELEHEVELFVGGSTAKDTYLRGSYDVDLFVRFDKNYSNEVLSNVLEEILLFAGLKFERVHGSRDYYQLLYRKLLFEIVPVHNITNPKQAETVTDMSPLHVTYVNSKLTPRMRDDIRLAKRFCQSARCYGAESYINGFSGHVIDLLIIHYGSFTKLLRAAATWTRDTKVVIDLEQHHKNPLTRLDKAKLYSPLVVVDPVQPDRNAAAALSAEKYLLFINAAKKYAQLSASAFTKPRMKIPKSPRCATITMTPFDGKDDVVVTKCLKSFEHIMRLAKQEGFTIEKYDFFYDGSLAVGYILVAEVTLPKTFEYLGPPVSARRDIGRFKQKHAAADNAVTEKDGRLYATVTRKYRTIKKLVKVAIKNEYVRSRVDSVRVN